MIFKLEDVLAIGLLPFVGAVVAMMIKLGLQGVKFAYITRRYLGNFDSFLKLVGVRVGSEFIKFTTPMFVGAEFIVIYYLHKKGVKPSKSTWIAIMDIVTEVFAGGLLSMMAGIIALLNGAYVVAAIILGTSISCHIFVDGNVLFIFKTYIPSSKSFGRSCSTIWKRKRCKIH